MSSRKHDWNTLENYLAVHFKVLRFYSSNMIVPQEYIHTKFTPYYHTLEAVGLRFRTYRGNEIRVDIRKTIEVDPDRPGGKPWARTFKYSYNANVPRVGNLVRYCSPHDDEDSRPIDHHRVHHKHDYTKSPPEVVHIPDDRWPHVGNFLDEVLSQF